MKKQTSNNELINPVAGSLEIRARNQALFPGTAASAPRPNSTSTPEATA
jgi:hypothetical protein